MWPNPQETADLLAFTKEILAWGESSLSEHVTTCENIIISIAGSHSQNIFSKKN